MIKFLTSSVVLLLIVQIKGSRLLLEVDCNNVKCALPKCESNQVLVTPDDQCCPICKPDCSATLCLKPECKADEELVVPDGECCPVCQPKLDCRTVLCLKPECKLNEELVVPDGECCPICQPIAQCALIRCPAGTICCDDGSGTGSVECCEDKPLCPTDRPSPGDACNFEGTCSYGSESCCGHTYPSFNCQCSQNGQAQCFYTDACLGGCPGQCQEDIKLCADGSSVVRDPKNNCQFPPCPACPMEKPCINPKTKQCDTLVQCIDDPCNTNNGGCDDKQTCSANYCGGCHAECKDCVPNPLATCPGHGPVCCDGREYGNTCQATNNCEDLSSCTKGKCPVEGAWCGKQGRDCHASRAAEFICPYDDKCACYGNCGECTYQDNGNDELECLAQIVNQNDVCPPKPCTKELKPCPDGSSVGRDSFNNCRFKQCPTVDCEVNSDCDKKNGFRCKNNPICRIDCDYDACKEAEDVCLIKIDANTEDSKCRKDADCDAGFQCDGIKRNGKGICAKYQIPGSSLSSSGVNNGVFNGGYVIEIQSPWIVIMIGILGIVLICNIILMCYRNKTGKQKKGYGVVKYVDSEDVDDSEAKPINIQ